MAYKDVFEVLCPYCEEKFSLDFDFTEGNVQSFEFDCPVCCNPVDINVRHTEGSIEAEAVREF